MQKVTWHQLGGEDLNPGQLRQLRLTIQRHHPNNLRHHASWVKRCFINYKLYTK